MDREILIALGNYIKEAREQKGMSQQELGDKLGLSQTYISYVEKGGRELPFRKVLEFCKELDVSLNDFLENNYPVE